MTYFCPMRILTVLLFLAPKLFLSQGTVIFNVDFQQGIPMATFSLVDNDGNTPNAQVSEFNQAWIAVVDPENLMDTVAAATSFFTTPDTASRWLITPGTNLGAFGNYLTWEAKSQDASYPDNYVVLASKTDLQLSSFTDTLFSVTGENFEWTSREANLTAFGLDNETVFIAFVLNTYDGFKLYIDDIQIRNMDDTGMDDFSNQKPFLSPNPAVEHIFINHLNESFKTDVFNTSGALIYSGETKEIPISNWKSGSYLVKISTATQVYFERFIKL